MTISAPLFIAALMLAAPGGPELQTDALRDQFVQAKIIETKNILAKAYENPKATSRDKEIFSVLWNYLQNEKINYPPVGQEYLNVTDDPDYCKKTMAFALSGRVYLCGAMLDQGLTHSEKLPSILIHEVAHATNIDRHLHGDEECGADIASVIAYQLAGKRSPALDGYYVSSGRCSIQSP